MSSVIQSSAIPDACRGGMNDEALDELGKTTWRDDQWLGCYPLNHSTVLDYFSLSPFYDRSCNNEVAKTKNIPIACALCTFMDSMLTMWISRSS